MPQYHNPTLASLFRSVVSLTLLFPAAFRAVCCFSLASSPSPLASLRPHYSTSEGGKREGNCALKRGPVFPFPRDHPVSIAPAWDGPLLRDMRPLWRWRTSRQETGLGLAKDGCLDETCKRSSASGSSSSSKHGVQVPSQGGRRDSASAYCRGS